MPTEHLGMEYSIPDLFSDHTKLVKIFPNSAEVTSSVHIIAVTKIILKPYPL